MANRSDNFNRSGNVALGGSTPSDGLGVWTDLTSSFLTGLISGELVAYEGSPVARNLATLDCGATDAQSEAEITRIDSQGGCTARVQDASNYYAFLATSAGATFLFKFVGGSGTPLGTSTQSFTPGLGNKLSIKVSGSTIQGYVGTTLSVSVTDTTFTSGTNFGIYSNNSFQTFNSFDITAAGVAASTTITEQNLPANHLGNIIVHAVGTGTSYTSSTTWTLSGPMAANWSLTKTFVDSTHYTLTLTPPTAATPPLGTTGTLTITEGVTGTTAGTTTIGTPTLSISPSSGATGTTPLLTMTATYTLWASETLSTLFSESGGTGASIGTPTLGSPANTSATATLTVGSAATALTIIDSSTGATATFTATAGTVTITSPVANQFRWRGSGGSATFTVSGTYTGSPTSVQVSHDGTTWATLDPAPSAGAFSGTVTLGTGQYTLSVRFSSNHTITASVTPVSVAYVLACAGQSNMSGRIANNQLVYAPPGIVHPMKTLTGYAALADPYGASVDSGSLGSMVPAMVSALANLLGAPVGIVPTAQGGTSITQWQPGNSSYTYLKAAVLAVGGADGVLWWQGETDMINAMSTATYHSNLASLAASILTDLACPLVPCALQQLTNTAGFQANQDAINAAIVAGWTDIANIKRGPDLRGMPTAPEDTLHLKTDAKASVAGADWAAWVYKSLFQPTGGGSGGAILSRQFLGMGASS